MEDTWASWSSGNYDQFNGQVNNASSTDNNWYLTGTQLEVGDSASDFEHRPRGEELSLCERYFFQSSKFNTSTNGTSNDLVHYFSYSKNSNAWDWGGVDFQTTMRAQPTVTVRDGTTEGKICHFTSNAGASSNNKTPYGVRTSPHGMMVHDYLSGSIYGFNCAFKADAEL